MAERMLVPVAHLAKIFSLTERRIQQLAADDIIPRAERGQYPFLESVTGYIKFLQERAFGKSDNSTDSHHERTRYLKAKADLTELDVQERNGDLISASAVRDQDFKLARILRNNLQSIPDRTAPLLAANMDAASIHKALYDEINLTLEQIISAMASTEVDDATLDITRARSAEQLAAADPQAQQTDQGDHATPA